MMAAIIMYEIPTNLILPFLFCEVCTQVTSYSLSKWTVIDGYVYIGVFFLQNKTKQNKTKQNKKNYPRSPKWKRR